VSIEEFVAWYGGAYAPAYHATNSSMDALPANRS